MGKPQQDLSAALQGAMRAAGLQDEALFSQGFRDSLDAFLRKQVGCLLPHMLLPTDP